MAGMRNVFTILVRNRRGKDNLEDPGVDGRIILKWILKKKNMSMWTAFIWSGNSYSVDKRFKAHTVFDNFSIKIVG
jgi:hypothetical protein